MNFEDRLRRELRHESESLPVVGVDLGGTLKRGRQVRRRSMLVATSATALVIAVGIAGVAFITRLNEPGAPLHPGGNPTSPATESNEPPTSPSPSPTSSNPPSDDGTLDDTDVLRLDGLGPLRIGMTVEEAEAATGLEARIDADFTPACRYMQLIGGPPDVFYMVSHRVLVRIDVGLDSKILTDTGLGIGDGDSAVRDVYGSHLTTEPHPYLFEQGSYLIVDEDPGDGLLMIFETDRGEVTQFRSGYDEQARYIEGCA